MNIDRVEVVVPARDEAETLEAHLTSLLTARDCARRTWPGLDVRATLVLDSCTDDSVSIATRHPWVEVLEVELGCVGLVRRAGLEQARARRPATDATRVWVACTDADSVVPPRWLVTHLQLAARGHQLVVGAVRPQAGALPPIVRTSWRLLHPAGEGHDHVHGANLGMTLSAYDLAGGFAGLHTGEDVDLVQRIQATTDAWLATAADPVSTSARMQGRAPAGFAAYLLALTRST